MQRMICALLLSFVAMLVVSPRVIPVLHRLKFGQTIYDLGPKSHKSKQGTPTMGGIMMAGVTPVSYTHLDVYKRQAFSKFHAFCSCMDSISVV